MTWLTSVRRALRSGIVKALELDRVTLSETMMGARLGIVGLLIVMGSVSSAQELEPRAYAPSPTGGNVVLLAYGRSSGAVTLDPSLPVSDIEAGINSATALYGRTFGFLGRSANVGLAAPYVWGGLSGKVQEVDTSITRSGLGDLRGKLTVNIVGGPAMSPREYAAQRPRSVLGGSVSVVAPTGQYDPAVWERSRATDVARLAAWESGWSA